MIEFSRIAANCMRSSATKFSPSESLWHIYSDQAYIYEGYARSYELILKSEGHIDVPFDVETAKVEITASRRVRKRSRIVTDPPEVTS
jgi:hypothetical protein